MGYLNIGESELFSAYVNNAVPYAKLYAYYSGTETLSPIFRDSGLTLMRANPMIANSAGSFDPVYLMDGEYRIYICDPREKVLLEQDGVAIDSEVAQDVAHWFRKVEDLTSDQTLAYLAAPNKKVVVEGDLVKAGESDFLYKVAAPAATDHHLTTAGGIKLYVVPVWVGADGGIVNACAFGVNSGVPNSDAAAAQKAIDAGNYAVYFPGGEYNFDAGLTFKSKQRYFGDGMERTILKFGAGVADAITAEDNMFYSQISDMTIRGVNAPGSRGFVAADFYGALLQRVFLRNFETNADLTNARGYSSLTDCYLAYAGGQNAAAEANLDGTNLKITGSSDVNVRGGAIELAQNGIVIDTTDGSVPSIRIEHGVHFEKNNVEIDITGNGNGVVKVADVYLGNKKNSLQAGNAYIKQSGQKVVLQNIFFRPGNPAEVAVQTGLGTTFSVATLPPATATQGFVNRMEISKDGYLDSPAFVTAQRTAWNADGKFTISGPGAAIAHNSDGTKTFTSTGASGDQFKITPAPFGTYQRTVTVVMRYRLNASANATFFAAWMTSAAQSESASLATSGGQRFHLIADNTWRTGYFTVDVDSTGYLCYANIATASTLDIAYFDIGFCVNRTPVMEADFA